MRILLVPPDVEGQLARRRRRSLIDDAAPLLRDRGWTVVSADAADTTFAGYFGGSSRPNLVIVDVTFADPRAFAAVAAAMNVSISCLCCYYHRRGDPYRRPYQGWAFRAYRSAAELADDVGALSLAGW